MTVATADRTYWRAPIGATQLRRSKSRAWHAQHGIPTTLDGTTGRLALCGRFSGWLRLGVDEHADRVPSNGHLCGSCARVIAARTDVEA